jgi:hypothetical protein
MEFYLNNGVEIQLAPDISKNVVVINNTEFWHKNVHYTVIPREFNINDVYFMFAEIVRSSPNKKIFIHHFEPLAHDNYVMYFAVEK